MKDSGFRSKWDGGRELLSGILFAGGMPLLHLLGYIGGVFALPSIRRKEIRDRGGPFLVPFALLLSYMFLRSLLLEHPRSGILEAGGALLTWGLPFVAGLAVARRRDELFLLYTGVWVVLIGAALLSAAGVLPEYLLGRQRLWSEGMIWALHHHNDFAACMLFLLPVLLALALTKRTAARWALLAVIFTGFVLSGSRGYYLAFPAVLAGFLVTHVESRKTRLLVGAALIAGFLVLAAGVAGIRTRFEWMLSVDASMLTRINLLRIAGWVLAEHPFTGIGFGRLEAHGEYLERLTALGLTVDVGGSIEHLHNLYATVAVEGGLMGLGLLCWMLLGLGRVLVGGDRLARALLWGYVGLLAGNLFDTQLAGPTAGIDFFFMAGLFSGAGSPGAGGGELSGPVPGVR